MHTWTDNPAWRLLAVTIWFILLVGGIYVSAWIEEKLKG